MAAGVLTVGAALAVSGGAGTAHADDGESSSAGGRSTAAAKPAAAQHGRGPAATGAVSASRATAAGIAHTPSPVAQSKASVAPAPVGQSQTSTTYGTAAFQYTGGHQTWTVPTGVQSVSVTLQGGFGGPCGITSCISSYSEVPPVMYPAVVGANLAVNGGSSPPITVLDIAVGGSGAGTDSRDGGAGGYNGGAPGGSGSLAGQGGAGGGGATTLQVAEGGPLGVGVVLVAGGGGGSGGQRTGEAGFGGYAGGVVNGGPPPAGSGGIWSAGSGTDAFSDNAGAGGAGGAQTDGSGSAGGDAGDVTGNGGGGGGGGGYRGGSGGQAGQASADPFATAGSGGGGGGGSSYADPTLTSQAFAQMAGYPATATEIPPANLLGSALIQWVEIVTTSIAPIRVGRTREEQLLAAFGNDFANPTWQVTGGALPAGLTLSSTGLLSGRPTETGSYTFQATVSASTGANSVITYTGTVCSRRCWRAV